jgi:hypothetical protein
MMPTGAIWQELRIQALDTAPSSIRVRMADLNSLGSWYQRGYFTVVSATKREFELRTAPDEIGTALFSEVEHFLDAAAEHQASLWQHVNASEWLSPAWMAVTFYYWAFFLCLSLTRLIGQTVWFIDRPAAKALSALAPAPASGPGAGCFLLSCGPVTTLSERQITLRKTGGRLHDELWIRWGTICESKLKRLKTGSSTSVEERVFSAVVRSNQVLGPYWPSAFRNLVNYRPAFAYSAVRRRRVLPTLTYLRTPRNYDMSGLLDRYESTLSRLPGPSAITDDPRSVAALLTDHTFLLHVLADALYREVLDRQHFDRRWAESRIRFLTDNGIFAGGRPWPC